MEDLFKWFSKFTFTLVEAFSSDFCAMEVNSEQKLHIYSLTHVLVQVSIVRKITMTEQATYWLHILKALTEGSVYVVVSGYPYLAANHLYRFQVKLKTIRVFMYIIRSHNFGYLIVLKEAALTSRHVRVFLYFFSVCVTTLFSNKRNEWHGL